MQEGYYTKPRICRKQQFFKRRWSSWNLKRRLKETEYTNVISKVMWLWIGFYSSCILSVLKQARNNVIPCNAPLRRRYIQMKSCLRKTTFGRLVRGVWRSWSQRGWVWRIAILVSTVDGRQIQVAEVRSRTLHLVTLLFLLIIIYYFFGIKYTIHFLNFGELTHSLQTLSFDTFYPWTLEVLAHCTKFWILTVHPFELWKFLHIKPCTWFLTCDFIIFTRNSSF